MSGNCSMLLCAPQGSVLVVALGKSVPVVQAVHATQACPMCVRGGCENRGRVGCVCMCMSACSLGVCACICVQWWPVGIAQSCFACHALQ